MLTGEFAEQWRQSHGAKLTELEKGGWMIRDSTHDTYQLLELYEPGLRNREIRLTARIKPTDDNSTHFCVHHMYGIDIAVVDRDGGLVSSDQRLRFFRCEVDANGIMELEVAFWNEEELISVGMAKPGSKYPGSGTDQYLIMHLAVIAAGPLYEPTSTSPLVVVDVGAREGYDQAWTPYLHGIKLVMFEPDIEEADKIRARLAFGDHLVIDKALSNLDGAATLHITKVIGCSSLLRPDSGRLKNYHVGPWFEVVDETQVECSRYDTLYAKGRVPKPDIIKIDVQGLEYQVLEGFGELLKEVIAIELESHFLQFYQDQKLLGDIVGLLDGYGFALRNIVTQGYERFNREVGEVNAFFTTRRKDRAHVADFVERVWAYSLPR